MAFLHVGGPWLILHCVAAFTCFSPTYLCHPYIPTIFPVQKYQGPTVMVAVDKMSCSPAKSTI